MPEDHRKDEVNKYFLEAVLSLPVVNKDRVKNSRPLRPKKAFEKTIDLHGFKLGKAIDALIDSIDRARLKNYNKITIITGKGKHSNGLYSPLYIGIENYLSDNRSALNIEFKKGDGFFRNMLKNLIFIMICILTFSSCSKYYRFDELYDKGEYLNAFNLLDQIKNKKNIYYQKRLYRIVLRLAFEGDQDFLQRLKNLTVEEHLPDVDNYIFLAKTYELFIEAKDPQQYSMVVSNLADIRTTPEEFWVFSYKIRGISNYKIGKYNETIADLDQSYRIVPYADNFYFIGMAYYNLEEIKQAENYFRKGIAESQNNYFKSLSYFQLGEIDYYQNKFQEALENYVNAVNNYSNSADYAYRIAKCLQKLKYNHISQKFLKVSLKIQKDYANAWFFLNIN